MSAAAKLAPVRSLPQGDIILAITGHKPVSCSKPLHFVPDFPKTSQISDSGLSCSARRSATEEAIQWATLWLMFFDGIPLELQAVMEYLASEKDAEADLWLRDDLQIAWLTCLYAGRGRSDPHVEATYKVLGLHPDKVWKSILAQRLAKGFPGSTTDGNSGADREAWEKLVLPRNPAPLASSPKKPCRSVRFLRREQA